eukprot:tig00020554_g10912.t1
MPADPGRLGLEPACTPETCTIPTCITRTGLSEERALEAMRKQDKALFEDDLFKAGPSSLYRAGRPSNPAGISWLRPSEFAPGTPALFIDGAKPGDVQQGGLGDCWYTVQFYKDEFWHRVLIDDRIPCRTADRQPIYASCKDPNELWVPLIEKAYAKLHGCYENLEGGICNQGVKDLTGGYPETIDLQEISPAQARDGPLWPLLLERFAEGSLMGCSHSVYDAAAREAAGEFGLLKGHAYGILEVREVKRGSDPVRLLRIRNPWGCREWLGPWSDGSKEWTPQLLAELGYSFADDGTFWMAWADFLRTFNMIYICRIFGEKWTGQRVLGEWKRGVSAHGCPNHGNRNWVLNRQFHLQVPSRTNLCVVLSQSDVRVQGKAQMQYPASLGFFVCRAPSASPGERLARITSEGQIVAQSGLFAQSRETSAAFPLDAGHYKVIPMTFEAGQEARYCLAVWADADVALEGETALPAFPKEGGGDFQAAKAQLAPAPPEKVEVEVPIAGPATAPDPKAKPPQAPRRPPAAAREEGHGGAEAEAEEPAAGAADGGAEAEAEAEAEALPGGAEDEEAGAGGGAAEAEAEVEGGGGGEGPGAHGSEKGTNKQGKGKRPASAAAKAAGAPAKPGWGRRDPAKAKPAPAPKKGEGEEPAPAGPPRTAGKSGSFAGDGPRAGVLWLKPAGWSGAHVPPAAFVRISVDGQSAEFQDTAVKGVYPAFLTLSGASTLQAVGFDVAGDGSGVLLELFDSQEAPLGTSSTTLRDIKAVPFSEQRLIKIAVAQDGKDLGALTLFAQWRPEKEPPKAPPTPKKPVPQPAKRATAGGTSWEIEDLPKAPATPKRHAPRPAKKYDPAGSSGEIKPKVPGPLLKGVRRPVSSVSAAGAANDRRFGWRRRPQSDMDWSGAPGAGAAPEDEAEGGGPEAELDADEGLGAAAGMEGEEEEAAAQEEAQDEAEGAAEEEAVGSGKGLTKAAAAAGAAARGPRGGGLVPAEEEEAEGRSSRRRRRAGPPAADDGDPYSRSAPAPRQPGSLRVASLRARRLPASRTRAASGPGWGTTVWVEVAIGDRCRSARAELPLGDPGYSVSFEDAFVFEKLQHASVLLLSVFRGAAPLDASGRPKPGAGSEECLGLLRLPLPQLAGWSAGAARPRKHEDWFRLSPPRGKAYEGPVPEIHMHLQYVGPAPPGGREAPPRQPLEYEYEYDSRTARPRSSHGRATRSEGRWAQTGPPSPPRTPSYPPAVPAYAFGPPSTAAWAWAPAPAVPAPHVHPALPYSLSYSPYIQPAPYPYPYAYPPPSQTAWSGGGSGGGGGGGTEAASAAAVGALVREVEALRESVQRRRAAERQRGDVLVATCDDFLSRLDRQEASLRSVGYSRHAY